jgi:protein TonB
MQAVNHWYLRQPANLRRSYYSILIAVWVIILLIMGMGKLNQLRAARRSAGGDSGATIIMPTDTIRYSEMAPPPSLSSDQVAVAAELPEAAAPQAIEDVTSTVPLPVPDEQAEVATMATAKSIAGPSAPAATGTGAPVFVMPETTKQVYDDNRPAPVTFKYMKASVMPEPLSDVSPEYPEKARAVGMEGTVLVDMWLRRDGTVSIVQVYKTSGYPLLDSSAAKAAGRSTFKPARGADGSPVNVWVRRPFRFSLSGG